MSGKENNLPDGFAVLAAGASVYHSARDPPRRDSDEPGLVILCSWGWAQRKYIAKYTDGYQKLFPSSDILLIESAKADLIWRPRVLQRRRLAPAIEVIKATMKEQNLGPDDSQAPSILLVAMSDGGCNSAVNLALLLRESFNTQAMPIRALVLDSCPNVPHYGRALKGFTEDHTTRSLIPRLLGWLAINAFLSLLVLLRVVGSRSQFKVNSEALLSARFIAKSCPRVYIYSKADKLTIREVVDQHADEAQACGYRTERVLFERSAHCAHVIEDREKYWGAVSNVWNEGECMNRHAKLG